MCVVVLSRLIKYGMALLRNQSLTEILLIFNLFSQKTVNRNFSNGANFDTEDG